MSCYGIHKKSKERVEVYTTSETYKKTEVDAFFESLLNNQIANINTTLTRIADVIESLEAELNDLESTVADHETRIAALEAASTVYATYGDRITALENR